MHDPQTSQPVDETSFRRALSCFPTGVAVATTMSRTGEPIGMTISSFNSVSMQPPLILWSIALEAACLEHFRQTDKFAINILSATQTDISHTFAFADDRFAKTNWYPSALGLPLIEGVVAVLECTVWARYDGGDHEIIIGEICALAHNDAAPLLYGLGEFKTFPSES